MLSAPLKQTNEIDWIGPLKQYIRTTYGDDPERYSEECSTLNRLRQDMRGAGADSASGRDLLYRYYGQLELLDLRFPVDENHIKISFTWYVVQSCGRPELIMLKVRCLYPQTHIPVLAGLRESFGYLQHLCRALLSCGEPESLRGQWSEVSLPLFPGFCGHVHIYK